MICLIHDLFLFWKIKDRKLINNKREKRYFLKKMFFLLIEKKVLCLQSVLRMTYFQHRFWGISSVGRALAWHARGHRFESVILHKKMPSSWRAFFVFLRDAQFPPSSFLPNILSKKSFRFSLRSSFCSCFSALRFSFSIFSFSSP
jgi:hypothetical protein